MCKNSPLLTCLLIVSSLIFALVIAILFFFNILTTIGLLTTIAFDIARITIIIFALIASYNLMHPSRGLSKCICCFATNILVFAILTFFAVLLSNFVTIVTGSIFSAVLVFLLTLFLSLTVISIAIFLCCLIAETCKPHHSR